MKWLLLLVAGLVLVAADDTAKKQKAINGLLYKISEPIRSYYPELKKAATNWDPTANTDKCKDGGAAVERLVSELESGRLLGQKKIFSLFNTRQREEALMLVDVLLNCKDFRTFAANAAYFRERMNEGEFVYALYVGVTHADFTDDVILPPLYEVVPHMFTTVEVINNAYSAKMRQTPGKFQMEFSGTKKNPEQHLAYYGEDIGMMNHHTHWHMDNPFWWKGAKTDRKGELFFWSHHQLTARFDAERLSNYQNIVDELYWDHPIEEGYAPHITYRYGGEYPRRPDNKIFEDVHGVARIRDMKVMEDRVRDAIGLGYAIDTDGQHVPLDISVLGDIVEASECTPNARYYGSLHNLAHIMLGRQADPKRKFDLPPGVMEHFETSTRDPSFFRLHKYIDGLFKEYKDTLPPYTKEELGYSNVEITSVGIKGELVTFFEDFEFNLINALDDTETVDDVAVSATVSRLNHEDFAYEIGVNANNREDATVRIYMCPKFDANGIEYTLDEARWGCILVDKFWTRLSGGSNKIVRKSTDSTVTIPDSVPFETLIKEANEAVSSGSAMPTHHTHGCGFPHRLLLPKGNKEGLAMELFVSITSGGDAAVSGLTTNNYGGNYGYCGIRGKKYPDRQAMGYPLDRHVADASLFKQSNIKWTTVKIFFRE